MSNFLRFATLTLSLWLCMPNHFSQAHGTKKSNEAIEKALHLNPGVKVIQQLITGQYDKDLMFTTKRGRIILLDDSELVPLYELFDSRHYKVNDDGGVVNKKTGVSIPVFIFRYIDDDGTIVQVTRNASGDIEFVEIHEPDGTVTYLVKSNNDSSGLEVQDDGAFWTFEKGDMKNEVQLSDAIPIPNEEKQSTHHHLNVRRRAAPQDEGSLNHNQRGLYYWKRGDGRSDDCNGNFAYVTVAVAYDEEFCALYGSHDTAKSRIESVVSSASLNYYENDLCIKLVLTDIIEPNSCKKNGSSPYKDFNRDNACANDPNGDHFLFGFTKFMRGRRKDQDVSVDDGTQIQLFTGYIHDGAQLGCSWTQTYCDVDWAYSVNYMRNVWQPSEIVIYAHELGHSLGATHYSEDQKSYIMTPYVTSGDDGFSHRTVNVIRNYIEGRECYSTNPTDVVSEESDMEITATVYWPSHNFVYFFFTKNNVPYYSRYDMSANQVPGGYPRAVSKFWSTWPAQDWLPTGGFVSRDWQHMYLFQNNRFVEMDMNGNQQDGTSTQKIGCCWHGLPTNVDYSGMVLWPDGKLYLFAHDVYYKYDTLQGRADNNGNPRSIQSNWPNWPSGFIPTSGFVNGYAYIFGTMSDDSSKTPLYIRYNVVSDHVEIGFPRRVQDDWQGVVI